MNAMKRQVNRDMAGREVVSGGGCGGGLLAGIGSQARRHGGVPLSCFTIASGS
jgi:hypothetical protein